jgi:hypothetical protein
LLELGQHVVSERGIKVVRHHEAPGVSSEAASLFRYGGH